jgi:hypothetical protein
MYVNGRMIYVETVPGMGEEEMRRMVEGMNSSTKYLIYCRNFCKCHSVPPPSTPIKKKIFPLSLCFVHIPEFSFFFQLLETDSLSK